MRILWIGHVKSGGIKTMMGVSKKGYFCLFQPYIPTINYRCLEDLLLIFGPSRTKTQFSLFSLTDTESVERDSDFT